MKNLVLQMKNVVFRSKTLYLDQKNRYFKSKKFEIVGFSHIEFEKRGILREIPGILKTWNSD